MISTHLHIKLGQALLRAATQQKAEDRVAADLESLQQLSKDARFVSLLQNVSLLPNQEARKVLSNTFHGKVHELTLNLLVMLAYQKSLQYLGKVAGVYRNAYHDAKGITEITIRTAREFSPQEQLAFVQKIQSKKKKTVTVKFEIDASLIGGAQIYEQSYLTDYSIKNYLETLKKQLLVTNY